MLQRQTNTSIIIGAAIIGISLVIALNFGQFAEWAKYATYHLSGQATADKEALQTYYANQKAQEAIAKQIQQAQEAQQAQFQQERAAATRALETAWQNYLTTNRPQFKQIDVIRDTQNGDYVCLHIFYGPAASDYHFNLQRDKEREQMANQWTYDLQDRIADGFVQWLNSARLLTKTDWRYDDLKDMLKGNRYLQDISVQMNNCLIPNQVWRANRYQRRIE